MKYSILKQYLILLFPIVLFGACSGDEPKPYPDSDTGLTTVLCTPNPSKEAKNVYQFLLDNYQKRIISGSMAYVAWNTHEAELVYKATEKYPAMAVFDYIHLASSPANWIDYSKTKIVEAWWNANGLVGACWHWNVPKSENAGTNDMTCDADKTTFSATKMFEEGTWENRLMKSDLEKIAGYLKLLQEKNIPVIWRPLHEAAGNIYEYSNGKAWFWWGNSGAETYKKLWIYMFDYFQSKGLNNLIWVWTAQTKDDDFYPGDAYVDIIGRDLYNKTDASYLATQYKVITNSYPNKMLALSECGKVAKISSQWNAGSHWSFFTPWYDSRKANSLDGHEQADTQWWKDAMVQPNVITREQMPNLK